MTLIQRGLKGTGYFCIVKQLQHSETGELFALKELKKEHFENADYKYRLKREIELLKILQESNNIINVLEESYDEENKKLGYLMPFADNNLHNYIKINNQKLTESDRFQIIEQIISAIKFAHSKSILHRDLSPNNILVFKDGASIDIKVSDFGLGKNKESLSFYSGSSVNGYGQAFYVSPEQREKLKNSSIKSDIYSLGKVIYFIWTGKDPVDLKTTPFSSLISTAIDENLENRFSDIQELETSYLKIKKILLNQLIPEEYKTLEDLLNESIDENTKIEWNHFHLLILKGNSFNHVYDDFLYPAISILNTSDKIKEYYQEVGNGFIDFLKSFCTKMNECLGTVGWPFRSMSDFGTLLKRAYLAIEDENIELLCLQNLWYLGYYCNQWSVQSDFKDSIQRKPIRTNIVPQLGESIIDNPTKIDMSSFSHLRLQAIIKVSMIEGDKKIKAQEENEKLG